MREFVEKSGRLNVKSKKRSVEEDLELICCKKRKLYVELFSPSNEICVDSEQRVMCETITTTNRKSPHREISAIVMPSEAELEEFFVAAEKSEQKRFAEKYNYDIGKDVPLEGKYEWVRLHP